MKTCEFGCCALDEKENADRENGQVDILVKKPYEHDDPWERFDRWEKYVQSKLPDDVADLWDDIDPVIRANLYAMYS